MLKFSYGLIFESFVLEHSFNHSLSLLKVATLPTHKYVTKNSGQV